MKLLSVKEKLHWPTNLTFDCSVLVHYGNSILTYRVYETIIQEDYSQAVSDHAGAGKLDDLEHFRSQWQRELNDKNKEENDERRETCDNSDEDEEEEDDVHRKVSVSMVWTSAWYYNPF